MPDDRSTAESTSSWGVVDMDHLEDEVDAAQFLKQSSGSEHVWCEYYTILTQRSTHKLLKFLSFRFSFRRCNYYMCGHVSGTVPCFTAHM